MQASYPLPGFHELWVRHAYQFTIMRLVAPRPVGSRRPRSRRLDDDDAAPRRAAAPALRRPQLGWGEPAVRARTQVSQRQRAEPDPLQRSDRVADRLAHPLDLALAALVDRQLDRVRRDPPDARRGGHAVVEPHARPQRSQRAGAHRRARHDRPVGLRRPRTAGASAGARAHRRWSAGSAPSLSASSRPTGYRRSSARHERDDRPAAVGVAGGRDDAGRLVQRVHDPFGLAANRPPVHGDVVALGHVARRVGAPSLRPTVTRPARMSSSAARRDATPADAKNFAEPHGPATIECDGSRAARIGSLDRLGEPAYRARPGVAVGRAAARRLRRDDEPPARAPRRARPAACRSRRSRSSARLRARDGTVKALFSTRRTPGRGRADALPRRAALAVPVLAVRLPADVHVLRHRPDAVRPQPDGLGDPRPSAPLPPARSRSTTRCSWAWASR